MALERAFVFRQLDGDQRFARFGPEDMAVPVLALVLMTLASLALDFHPLYNGAVFGALTGASWVLRTQLEDPPLEVAFFWFAPKHLSSLAPDRYQKPYPGAPPQI
ncbi:hypothetical protein D7Y04_41870 [Corallococcus sp. AB038B]|nr:hypothetical protein D7Y04_41870 [Corallococcus sp. AB038B]